MNFQTKQQRDFFVFYTGNERKTQITLMLVVKMGNKAEARPNCVTGKEDKIFFYYFRNYEIILSLTREEGGVLGAAHLEKSSVPQKREQ